MHPDSNRALCMSSNLTKQLTQRSSNLIRIIRHFSKFSFMLVPVVSLLLILGASSAESQNPTNDRVGKRISITWYLKKKVRSKVRI